MEQENSYAYDDSKTENDFPYPIACKNIGGVDTIVTTAEAKNAFATLHFLKGFKSSPYLYEDLMHALTDHGINVVLISLPDPEDEIDFLEDYEQIARAVYIDGELDYLHDPELPMIAANHSIGGFLFTKFLMDEENAKAISERYESAFLASPFYGSKYHRIPVLKTLTYLYSIFNASAHVGTTWLERQFLHAANDNYSEGKKALANHRQALYMDVPTNELVNEIRLKGFPEISQKFPVVFHTAAYDQVSFNALTTEVASHLNSKLISSLGGHSHIRETEAGQRLLIYEILDVIQKKWLQNALDQDEVAESENQTLEM